MRDSAGVLIAESTVASGRASDESWRLADEPLLIIRSEGDDYALTEVVGALGYNDGSIVVAERTMLRLFDRDGQLRRTVGGEGDGPGEFRRISDIDRYRGDSLVAFDSWLRRVTVLGPDLDIGRVVTLEGAGRPIRVRSLRESFVAMISGTDWADPKLSAGWFRPTDLVVRFSSDGGVRDSVTTIPGSEVVLVPQEGGWTQARPLFGARSHLASRGGQAYVGSAATLQYKVYDASGRLQRIVRVPSYPLDMTEDELEAERQLRLDVNPSQRARRSLEELPAPETKPAYAEMVLDSEGFVWLGEHQGEFGERIGGRPRQWEVFDSVGAWLGSMETPARFRVFDIGSDFVLGAYRDRLDLEHIHLLQLDR